MNSAPASAHPAVRKSPAAAAKLEVIAMSKWFGSNHALSQVSMMVQPGQLHALLGENGAGKSTLVKCIMGFYKASAGQLLLDNREVQITDPAAAQQHALGMVYQHFTLVPSLSGYENLVVSRRTVSSIIHWHRERNAIDQFMQRMPFSLDLSKRVSVFSAGEKQKLEIIKQLYLGCRLLILDEPTSVLTPLEADEVLGHIRAMCASGELSVLMITHKFREVMEYADQVTVLRAGQAIGSRATAATTERELAGMMIGDTAGGAVELASDSATPRGADRPQPLLEMTDVAIAGQSRTQPLVNIDYLRVQSGQIVGVAGVSGNGQTELVEALGGQRALSRGQIRIDDQPYRATRAQARAQSIRVVPEEPLHNACAQQLSVSENLSFRSFDEKPAGNRFWLSRSSQRQLATQLCQDFNVKTSSIHAPLHTLSGGNVQRAVLARELHGSVKLLIVSNPCFGLDFGAAADIHRRLMRARQDGTAILLFSEDLDEILALADHVVVMSGGKISYRADIDAIDRNAIGRAMGGH